MCAIEQTASVHTVIFILGEFPVLGWCLRWNAEARERYRLSSV